MRHRFHALCPYFAMFPERFVQKSLIWSDPNDLVFDPFSGRGTTVFESLLNGRRAAACDTNPVAVCVSRAKARPPTRIALFKRLKELEEASEGFQADLPELNADFFGLCFHHETFSQIEFLRRSLRWRSRKDDCFIAALALGSLHGESHRSERYFSNRMPRTISTKPQYSVKWWRRNKCTPPQRDVFAILRTMVDYRYTQELPALQGLVREGDARSAAEMFPELKRKVSLLVTSPPYLDTTHFEEDQWLRLWFLGGRPTPQRQGPTRDDRHTNVDAYWQFLEDVWQGVGPLLKARAHIVVRIGGRLDQKAARKGLRESLATGLNREIRLRSERKSAIGDGQIKTFRPGSVGTKYEYDFHFQLA